MSHKKYQKAKKAVKQYGNPRSFMPKGGFRFIIYAVTLVEWPTYVKVGRTMKWSQRRKVYADWNFAKGHGIERETVFTINEEFIDLEKLEYAILTRMKFERAHGAEWFVASMDDAVAVIEAVLSEHGIVYEKE